MSVIRAFIAINISPEIASRLASISGELQQQLQEVPIRWVPVENVHITLKFLGDVSESNLGLLKEMLEAEAGRHAPLEISAGELGAFPSIRRPRVLWVNVQAPPELLALQRSIDNETARLGYDREERPFSAHLTIGRVSRNANSGDARRISEVLESYKVGYIGAARIREVVLYRSDLYPTGAVYTAVFAGKLGGRKVNP